MQPVDFDFIAEKPTWSRLLDICSPGPLRVSTQISGPTSHPRLLFLCSYPLHLLSAVPDLLLIATVEHRVLQA